MMTMGDGDDATMMLVMEMVMLMIAVMAMRAGDESYDNLTCTPILPTRPFSNQMSTSDA